MKKTIILASAVAALVLTSCGFGKSATTNNTTSTTATTTTATATTADGVQMGKNAGMALENLAAQYKADGKLDMTNIMNIAQMLNLVGAAQQVYNNKSNKEYRQSFIKGMIANSINIDEVNAGTITDSLSDMMEETKVNELQSAMQKGQATATEVQNVANSVTNIISMFKK
ncbi:MAG: hypothetical protein IJ650_03995 [Paludibacteraceae bacterium]|nr:hypothetical protein [Paludibacteraceae bacterium]